MTSGTGPTAPRFVNYDTGRPQPINSTTAFASIFDFMSPGQIADISTGNPTIDLSSVINSAFAKIGKGTLVLPPGVFGLSKPIIIGTGQYLQGAARGATTIRNLPGPATTLVQTAGYASLVGTNTVGGPYQWGISDILFDGNRANVTGTADVIDIYGYDYSLTNVTIWNSSAQGLFSQWATGATVPVPSGGDGMEAHIYYLKIYNSAGVGLNFQGPHDSQFNQVLIIENNNGAFFQTGGSFSADGTFLNNFHSYGNQGAGLFISANEIHGSTIESESNFGIGINVGFGGVGSLIASDVFAFNNGRSSASDGITLQGFRSCLTGVYTRNNSQNGLTLAGTFNQAMNIVSASNSNIGVVMSGNNATVVGATSNGNTNGQYQNTGTGNNLASNF